MKQLSQNSRGTLHWVTTTLLAVLLGACGGGGGGSDGGSAPAAPTPAPGAVTVTISANPTSVASGSTATLTWSSTNASSCTASGSWSGTRPTSGTETTAAITAGAAYTLTCTGAAGMAAATANVAVAPVSGAQPTVTITANPASVTSGASSILTWSSTDATSCVASGNWTGSKGISGTETIANITAASAFTLTCTGAGGMGSSTANVAIAAPSLQPTVTIIANPTVVASGGSSTLTWTSGNTTTCTASGGWSGTKTTSGSQVIPSITAASAFTLTCSGPNGMASGTANVSLTGSYATNFDRSENPISEGGAWSRSNNGFTNVSTNGDLAFGTNGMADKFDDSYALLRGFGPNQTAEAVIQRANDLNTNVSHEVELLLRFSDDNITARGYECLFSFSGSIQIIRWDGLNPNNGSMGFLVLPIEGARTFGALTTGRTIKASIIGNEISVFIDGQLAGKARDSTYTAGQPGIGFFTRPGGDSAKFAITSYKASSN